MLWDCKREALRGLGVNTEEGHERKINSVPIMERELLLLLSNIHR